jgi:hypothetical protein
MNNTDGPIDVEKTFHFTPQLREHIHRHCRDSRCNPSAQIGNSTLSLCTLSLGTAPQRSPWVFSQDSVGANESALPYRFIDKKIVCSQKNVKWHQNGQVHHLVWKWSREIQLLSVETKSSLAYPGKLHTWWGSRGRSSVQQFGPTWRRTSRWYWGCHKHAPRGHAGCHSHNPCNCGGLQHRACGNWPHRRRFHAFPTCHVAMLPSL